MTVPEQLTEPLTRTELTDGRVLLRPPTLADVAAVTAACQDPDIARWTTVPAPYAASDAVFFVEQVSDPGWAKGTDVTFAVTDRADGALLGACGLKDIDRTHRRGEIGYWITATARGRGVATSAVRWCAAGRSKTPWARCWPASSGVPSSETRARDGSPSDADSPWRAPCALSWSTAAPAGTCGSAPCWLGRCPRMWLARFATTRAECTRTAHHRVRIRGPIR